MDDRLMQFRVGVMVLATIIIGAILLVVMGEVPKLGFGRSTYELEAKFDRAPGVTKDTPVRKSGILIGRVSDVRFAEDSSVIVTMGIHEDVRLRVAERAQIKGGLLGDAVIEFVSGPKKATPGFWEDGDTIDEGIVVSDPFEVFTDLKGEFSTAIQTFNQAGTDIGTLANNLNRVLEQNDNQIARVMNQTEQALVSFNRAMTNVEKIAGDEEIQAGLKKSLADLPKMLDESRATFQRVQQTIELADKNLASLTRFTGPLGERGDQIVGRMAGSVEKIDQLLAQLVAFSKTINSSKGTVGELLNNPDLYQSLNRAARNVEEATEQLQPILDDAKGLMDKLNRHPGAPLRDAIRPGAGIGN
jgi:phospholipid/cholesterol/gamma-HCH transport system substrate-binding protein